MADDTAPARTHQEVELSELFRLRAWAAIEFTQAALELQQAYMARKSGRTISKLWTKLHEYRARYDCSCMAFEAMKNHRPDSHFALETQSSAEGAASDQRWRNRLAYDERIKDDADILRAVLSELRGLRDKIDPPQPLSAHLMKARES